MKSRKGDKTLTFGQVIRRIERAMRWAPTEVFYKEPDMSDDCLAFAPVSVKQRKPHCKTCECFDDGEELFRVVGCSATAAVLLPDYGVGPRTKVSASFWDGSPDWVDLAIERFPDVAAPLALPCGCGDVADILWGDLDNEIAEAVENVEDNPGGTYGRGWEFQNLSGPIGHLQEKHRWTRAQVVGWLRGAPQRGVLWGDSMTTDEWLAFLRGARKPDIPPAG